MRRNKCAEINAGVTQGSILGLLLFNIFLIDILFFINNTYLCKYGEDNTLYAVGKKLDKLKLDLKIESHSLFKRLTC